MHYNEITCVETSLISAKYSNTFVRHFSFVQKFHLDSNLEITIFITVINNVFIDTFDEVDSI